MDRLSEEEIMKYIKVTYRSEPIGKEGIVLELTTFDIEKWKNDKKLEHIPEKREKLYLKLDMLSNNLITNNELRIEYVQSQLVNFVTDRYEKQQKEINKKNKMIDLMARTILTLDDQLVINHYKNKEEVIERVKDLIEEE